MNIDLSSTSTQPVIINEYFEDSRFMGVCNPWNPKFPLLWYVILIIIGIIANIVAISRAPTVNKFGVIISNSQRWQAGIIAIILNILIGILFGFWMYSLAKHCETLNSWLVFVLAIFFPIILAVVVSIIASAILGVGYIFFI